MVTESKDDLSLMRVDHVGSLIRPARLVEMFKRHGAGEASENELKQSQDEAIREVIADQEAHNLPVVNDGEFRRVSFQDSFGSSASGFRAPKTLSSCNSDVRCSTPKKHQLSRGENQYPNGSRCSEINRWKSISLREALLASPSKSLS
jgi:methionine synthase II (cobalamin-independent)